MRTHHFCFVTILITTMLACRQKPEVGVDGRSGQQSLVPPVRALDHTANNELWSLAPEGTLLGGVVAPGIGTRLHSMGREILGVVAARPLGAHAVDAWKAEIVKGIGVDIFDRAALKTRGIDLDLGAALFMKEKDKGYLVLPVSDPVAFRKLANGTVESVDGITFDRYDSHLVCMPKEQRYLCAYEPAALRDFGLPVNSAFMKRITELPSRYRGALEIVGNVPEIAKADGTELGNEFEQMFDTPQLAVMGMQVGTGTLTARVWLQAQPKSMVAAASSVATSLSRAAAAENPDNLLTIRIPNQLWQSHMTASDDETLPDGLSLLKDIVPNLTGEFVSYSGSGESSWSRTSLGIRDSTPFQKVLKIGCGLLLGNDVPGVTVNSVGGRCDIAIDVSQLPLPGAPQWATMVKEPIPIAAVVEDGQFSVTLGTPSSPGEYSPSAAGREIFEGDWNIALWTQRIAIAQSLHSHWPKILRTVPSKDASKVKMAAWLAAHLNEFGISAAVRSDGIHGMIHVGTYAADPADAFSAYQSAVTASLDSQVDNFAALVDSFPQSYAAQSSVVREGTTASLIVGIVSAFAAMMASHSIE